jgi:hypothetical protein
MTGPTPAEIRDVNPTHPAPAVQRAMLDERIQMYRAAAFEAYVEAEAARAQTAMGAQEEAELEQRIRVLAQKSANCSASAARLQELLDGVPGD